MFIAWRKQIVLIGIMLLAIYLVVWFRKNSDYPEGSLIARRGGAVSYESLCRLPILEHILLFGKANMVLLKGTCGNQDLAIASKFVSLRTLAINGNVSSPALSNYIQHGSKTVEVLFLDNVAIQANGLEGIERFEALQLVYISDSTVPQQELIRFGFNKSILRLELKGVDISAETVSSIRSARPELLISVQ